MKKKITVKRNKRADLTNPTSPFYCGDSIRDNINDRHMSANRVVPSESTQWSDAPECEKPAHITKANNEGTNH